MSTRGRINVVKERLMALISTADAGLQPQASHVSGDWDFHRRIVGTQGIIRNLPYVTVRVNTDVLGHVYGRDCGDTAPDMRGTVPTITWSAHVLHSSCRLAGFDRHRNAQDLADKIIDYLVQQAGNQSAFGISDIYDITGRESTPREMGKKLTRIIIEGKMDCVRPD